jgi:hypothetical protein
MTDTTTTSPDVYLVLAGEACAFDTRGDIICAEILHDTILWDDGGIADHRGGGGQEGFKALHDALTAAERNAELVLGRKPNRLTTE